MIAFHRKGLLEKNPEHYFPSTLGSNNGFSVFFPGVFFPVICCPLQLLAKDWLHKS